MDINRKNMDAFFAGLSATFNSAFQSPLTQNYLRYAMEIPSTAALETFSFLEQVGGMREWIGDRQIDNLSSKKLVVENKDYEKTISVAKNDIEDDKYGIYSPVIADMGQNAAGIWNKLGETALKANGNWLDGEPFFSSSRKYGENAIVNGSTNTLSHANYGTARATMMAYMGHGGDALEVIPDLLIVGPSNEETGRKILNNDVIITGGVAESNPWKGSAQLLVLPSFAGAHAARWFLACTTRPLKPVAIQKRTAPALARMDKEGDENVFMRKTFLYGTDARGSAFLAVPHLLYGGGLDSVRGLEKGGPKEPKGDGSKGGKKD